MNAKQKQEIRNSLNICKMKLRTIEPHLQGDKPILNENYNKILIEKAVLRDKLMHKEPSFLKNLALKIKNYNRRELICDYFKTAPNKN